MDELLLRYLRKQTTEEENALVEEWVSGSPERERDLAEISRVVEALQMVDRRIVPGDPPATRELIRRAEAQRTGLPGRGLARTGTRLVPAFLHRHRYGLGLATMAVAASAVFLMFVTRVRVDSDSDSAAVDTAMMTTIEAASVEPVEMFTTGPGETDMVFLDDGTVIRLGPESQVSVEVGDTAPAPSPAARVGYLQGEAFFAVATDPERPFHILTAAGTARVVGTRFYLAAREDELAVTVVEGRVALTGPSQEAEEVEVGAGQAARLLDGLPTPIEPAAPIGSVAEWMDGFLIFHDTPLRVAMNEVEQQYGIEVLISDASLLDHTLTMWFDSESLPDVIRAVCSVIDARCNIDDAGVVRIAPAGREPAS